MEYIETKWGGRNEQEDLEEIRAPGSHNANWPADAWTIVHEAVSLFIPASSYYKRD